MKVAVLASPEDDRPLYKSLKTLASVDIDCYGLIIRDRWQELRKDRLLESLAKASHFLIVSTEASVRTTWFSYAAGYGHGCESGIAFLRLDSGFVPPPYLAKLPLLDTYDELAAYYQSEKADWLVREGHRSTRAALLEMGISFHSGSLAQCVKDGDTRAVELFLKAGLHPDTRDKHGVTLLCLAVRNNRRAVVELLLAQGADLDLKSEDRGYSPLMDAALVGATDLVELFLVRGADPDQTSKDGQTALVIAVGRNDVGIVKALLDRGADPDIADKLGFSARRYAGLFKNPAILATLENRPK